MTCRKFYIFILSTICVNTICSAMFVNVSALYVI